LLNLNVGNVIFARSKSLIAMSEKEVSQRKVAAEQTEQEGGKTMSPPTFQLMAGDAGGTGSGGPGGGGAAAKVAQKQDDKKGAKTTQKVSQGNGFSVYTTANTIVTIPDGATGTLPILTIVGGKSYATKEWMKGQTPANFFGTHILSFSNYGTGFTKSVRPDIQSAMATAGVGGSFKALIGFSAGGYRVEGAMGDESWSILGMIDAVATKGQSYPTTVLQIYNIWDGNDEKTDPRHLLHIRITNGDVQGQSKRDKKHDTMVAKWFDLYGGSL
jgi:hypothetical protein